MSSTAAQLAEATSDDITAARLALVAYLQERHPTLTLRGGPLADLVLSPASDALAAVDVRAAASRASLNPETALADGGYDEELLASVLAGRGVTRGAATKASGTVVLQLSQSTTRAVPSGFRLRSADGTIFVTSSGVRLLSPGQTALLPNDTVLVEVPGGLSWIGTVPVTAQLTGDSGNLTAGSALTAVDTLDTLTGAWAASDLAGGADEETDAELLVRLPSATAPRTAASMAGAEGLIRDAVPAISYVSAVKFGDAALMRGRSVLSTQTPGRFDLRYRTDAAPSRERVTVTATYQGLAGPYGTWQFALARDEAPARFRVEKVLQEDALITAAGYVPTAVTPGYSLSGVSNPPDIRSVADASLSRYATAIVVFTDPDTVTDDLTAGVSTRDYDAICRLIPSVEDAQDAVDDADARAAGGDCLVRTAVPVLVAVTAVATVASGVTLTAGELRAAVAAAVNATGFSRTLSAATVAANAVARLPQGTSLSLSGWSGTIYPIDSSTSFAATVGADGLSVAVNYDRNISDATVAYYCDPESVTASVA